MNLIVTHFENAGNSFTTTSLSNFLEHNNSLTAQLNLDIAKKRTIYNFVIKGYEEFPEKYLKHYLNIRINPTFNLNSIQELNELN